MQRYKTEQSNARERAERKARAVTFGQKAFSSLMAVVLAVGLMPLPAFGDDGRLMGVSFNGATTTLDNASDVSDDEQPLVLDESRASVALDAFDGAQVVNEAKQDAGIEVPDDVASLDFSTQRIIVALQDGAELDDRDADNVASEGDGLYLLQYKNVESAQKAYVRYSSNADVVFVAPDMVVTAADDTIESKDSDKTDPTDAPIAVLDADQVEADVVESVDDGKPIVALIDTGAPEGDNHVVEYYSVLEDGPLYDDGHGAEMLATMVAENPDVQVISIKALDSNGKGTAATVSAAIAKAVERGAAIINLSFSGYATQANAAIGAAIDKAVAAGATVIAAAGNDGNDARYYTPASVKSAFTVGAAGEDGARLASSNFGEDVDAYVIADSTSYAAARTSGWLSSRVLGDGGIGSWQVAFADSGLVGMPDGDGMVSDVKIDQADDTVEIAAPRYTITLVVPGRESWSSDQMAAKALAGYTFPSKAELAQHYNVEESAFGNQDLVNWVPGNYATKTGFVAGNVQEYFAKPGDDGTAVNDGNGGEYTFYAAWRETINLYPLESSLNGSGPIQLYRNYLQKDSSVYAYAGRVTTASSVPTTSEMSASHTGNWTCVGWDEPNVPSGNPHSMASATWDTKKNALLSEPSDILEDVGHTTYYEACYRNLTVTLGAMGATGTPDSVQVLQYYNGASSSQFGLDYSNLTAKMSENVAALQASPYNRPATSAWWEGYVPQDNSWKSDWSFQGFQVAYASSGGSPSGDNKSGPTYSDFASMASNTANWASKHMLDDEVLIAAEYARTLTVDKYKTNEQSDSNRAGSAETKPQYFCMPKLAISDQTEVGDPSFDLTDPGKDVWGTEKLDSWSCPYNTTQTFDKDGGNTNTAANLMLSVKWNDGGRLTSYVYANTSPDDTQNYVIHYMDGYGEGAATEIGSALVPVGTATDVTASGKEPWAVATTATTEADYSKPSEGCTFVGWAAADNSLETVSSSYVTGADTTPVYLYAVWQRDASLYLGTSSSAVAATRAKGSTTQKINRCTSDGKYSLTIGANELTVPTELSDAGWTAVGWTTSDSGTPSATVEHAQGSAWAYDGSSDEFYAVYSRDVSVTYNKNKPADAGTNEPTPAESWPSNDDTKDTQYLRSDSSGGTSSNVTFSLAAYSGISLEPGYTLDGWMASDTGNTTLSASYTPATTPAATGQDSNKVNVYGYWRGGSYSVTFKANGPSITDHGQTFNVGESQALWNGAGDGAFTWTGYDLAYWTTESGAQYDPNIKTAVTNNGKHSYTEASSAPQTAYKLGYNYNEGTKTLFAVWQPKTYTIKFDSKASDVTAPSSQNVLFNTALTSVDTNPTRTGYTFDGWHLDSGCNDAGYTGTAFIAAKATTMPTLDDSSSEVTTYANLSNQITLYAKWIVNHHTVSIAAGTNLTTSVSGMTLTTGTNGTGDAKSGTVDYGVLVTVSSSPAYRYQYADSATWVVTDDTSPTPNPVTTLSSTPGTLSFYMPDSNVVITPPATKGEALTLTIVADEGVSGVEADYSEDGGTTWSSIEIAASGNTAKTVPAGAKVRVKGMQVAGYTYSGWKYSSSSASIEPTDATASGDYYTFTMPTAATTLSPTVSKSDVSLTMAVTLGANVASATPNAGVVVSPSPKYKDEITLGGDTVKATGNTGYGTITWSASTTTSDGMRYLKADGTFTSTTEVTDLPDGTKFEMPATAVTVKPYAAASDYELTLQTDGNASTIALTATRGSGVTWKSTSGTTSVYTVKYGTEVSLTATPAIGYKLDETYSTNGYSVSTTASPAPSVTDGKITMPAANTTVTVKAAAIDYDVNLQGLQAANFTNDSDAYQDKDSTGTGAATGNYTAKYTVAGTTVLKEPSHAAYTFDGWSFAGRTGTYKYVELSYDSTHPNQVKVGVGDSSATTAFYEALGTLTFTANWTATPFTITYSSNGAGVSNQTQTLEQAATSVTLWDGSSTSSPFTAAFTREGYDLAYWSTDSSSTYDSTKASTVNSAGSATDGSAKLYKLGGSYGSDRTDQTLHAVWAPHTYTVKFDSQGSTSWTASGASAGVLELSNIAQGATIAAATVPAPVKDGYTFKGWFSATTGGTQFTVGTDTLSNSWTSGKSTGDTITLYAQWENKTYNLTSNVGDGTTVTPSTTKAGQVTVAGTGLNGLYAGDSVTVTSDTATSADNKMLVELSKGYDATSGVKYEVKATLDGGTERYLVKNGSSYEFTGTAAPATPLTGPFTFKMPAGSVEVTTSATPTTYTVKATALNHGTSNGTYNFVDSTPATNNQQGASDTKGNYNVTFNVKDNTGEEHAVSLANAAHDGYTFKGWKGANGSTAQQDIKIYYDATQDGGKVAIKSGSGTPTYVNLDDLSFEADWTIKTCTISFNAEGGTPTPTEQTVPYMGKISEPTGVTKGISELESWNVDNASGTVWNFDTDTITAAQANAGTLSLHAKWAGTFTITYKANSGTGADQTQNALEKDVSDNKVALWSGADVAGSFTAFTREGYTLIGWTDVEGGTTKKYELGGTWTEGTTDKTLYAVWQASAYKVVYHKNDGTSTTAEQPRTYGDNTALLQYTNMTGSSDSNTNWTRTGTQTYQFRGWMIGDASGATNPAVAIGENGTISTSLTYSGDMTTGTDDVHLWAKWGTNYTLDVANGGGVSIEPRTSSTEVQARTSSLEFLKKNDTVTLSSTATGATNQVVTTIPAGRGYDATAGVTYVVSADFSDGTKYLQSDGSTWDSEPANLTGTTVITMPAANVSVKASATPVEYKAFVTKLSNGTDADKYAFADGADASSANYEQTFTVKTIEGSAKATSLTDPTHAGYTFDGWTGSNGSAAKTSASYYYDQATNKIKVTAGGVTTDVALGNLTFAANWTIDEYTVTFDSQDGSPVAPSTASYKGKVTKPATDPTKAHALFAGWYKEAAGTNAWDFDTDTVSDDTKLYAKWTDAYELTLKPNASDASPTTDTSVMYTAAEPASLADYASTYTREGYSLAYWTTEKDAVYSLEVAGSVALATNGKFGYADDTAYTTSAAYAETSDTKLYAVWKGNDYRVVFHKNDGTNTTAEQKRAYADGLSLTAAGTGGLNWSREDYIFSGWLKGTNTGVTSSTVDYEDEATGDLSKVSGDVHLYASWTSDGKHSVSTANGGGVTLTLVSSDGTVTGNAIEKLEKDKVVELTTGAGTAANVVTAAVTGRGYDSDLTKVTFRVSRPKSGGGTEYLQASNGSWASTPKDLTSPVTFAMPEVDVSVIATAALSKYNAYFQKLSHGTGSDQFEFYGGNDATTSALSKTSNYQLPFDVKSIDPNNGGAAVTLSAPAHAGYDFTGWTGSVAGGVPTGSSPVKYWFDSDMGMLAVQVGAGTVQYTLPDNLTFIANWVPQKKTVTFNVDGGSAVTAQTVDYGEKASEPADPTKSGYRFDGWHKDSADGAAWTFGTDVVTDDVTIYAKWLQTFDLTLDPNYTAAPATQTQKATHLATEDVKLGDYTFVRDGYALAYWSTEKAAAYDKDVAKSIADNNGVSAEGTAYAAAYPTYRSSDNSTLYAVWQSTAVETYLVNFDTNGGSFVAAQNVEAGQTVAEPTAPTKSGYEFEGWYTDSSLAQDKKVTTWPYQPQSSIMLYAKWLKISTVTVAQNGVTGAAVTPDGGTAIATNGPVLEGKTVNLTGTLAPSAGYNSDAAYYVQRASDNKYWKDSTDGWVNSKIACTGSFTMPASDVTVTAAATPKNLKVTLTTTADTDAIAGYTANAEKTTYTKDDGFTVESEDFALPAAPTRTNYEFAGWTGEGITTPQKTVTIAKGTKTADVAYTANWTGDEKTLTVAASSDNSGKDGVANIPVTVNSGTAKNYVVGTATDKLHYGDTITLGTVEYATGYQAAASDAVVVKMDGTAASPKDGTTNAYEVTGNVTIELKAEARAFKIKYLPGAADTGTAQEFDIFFEREITLKKISELGFANSSAPNFEKWTGAGSGLSDGATYALTTANDVTLTANWTNAKMGDVTESYFVQKLGTDGTSASDYELAGTPTVRKLVVGKYITSGTPATDETLATPGTTAYNTGYAPKTGTGFTTARFEVTETGNQAVSYYFTRNTETIKVPAGSTVTYKASDGTDKSVTVTPGDPASNPSTAVVPYGATVTVTAPLEQGYKNNSYTVEPTPDPAAVTTDTDVTFTVGKDSDAAAYEVKATTGTPNDYTITYRDATDDSEITGLSPTSYQISSTAQAIAPSANKDGYAFQNWQTDDGTDVADSTTAIAANKIGNLTFKAVFKAAPQNLAVTVQNNDIAVQTSAGGTVPSTVDTDQQVALKADNTGHENFDPTLTKWTVQRKSDNKYLQADGSWADAPYTFVGQDAPTFKMPYQGVNIDVQGQRFTKALTIAGIDATNGPVKTYDATWTIPGSGVTTSFTSGQNVPAGASVTVTMTSFDTGKTADKWTYDTAIQNANESKTESSGASATFTMPADEAAVTAVAKAATVDEGTYVARYYQQKLNAAGTDAGTDYELIKTADSVQRAVGKDIVVSPTELYEGFVTPAAQTITVVKSDDPTYVDFRYARDKFVLSYANDEHATVDAAHSTGAGNVVYGAKLQLAATPAAGYTVDSWDVKGTAPSQVVSAVSGDYYMPAYNVTATPIATPKSYTVKFDVNAPTSETAPAAPGDITAKFAEGKSLPTVAATDHYDFAGWALANNATAADYASSITFDEALDTRAASGSPAGTLTLYGVWTPKTFDVTFNSNSGSAVETQHVVYNQKATEPAAPTRDGYTFGGWFTDNGTFANSYNFNTLVAANVALYAKWLSAYTLTFQANGGTGTMDAQQFTEGTAQKLNANAYTKTGYTFGGWTADGTNVKYTNERTGVELTANETVQAIWTPNTYTVAFNANEGAGTAMGSMSFQYDQTQNLTANSYQRPGFAFDGWNTKQDGSGFGIADQAAVKNLTTANGTTVTLYAQWKAQDYTITAVAGDGVASVTGSGTYAYNQSVTLSATPKAGYNTPTWDHTTTFNATENVTATATATPIQYTAQFMDGTSNITSSVGTVNYTVAGITPLPTTTAPAKSGYHFVGWYSDSALTQPVSSLGGEGATANATVYARYDANSVESAAYTVTYYQQKLDGNYQVADTASGTVTLTGDADADKAKLASIDTSYTTKYDADGFTLNASAAGTATEVALNKASVAELKVYYDRTPYNLTVTNVGSGSHLVAGYQASFTAPGASEATTITAGQTRQVPFGAVVTLTAAADSSYELNEWTLNGTALRGSATSSFTFEMPAQISTVTPSAGPQQVTLTVNASDGVSDVKVNGTSVTGGSVKYPAGTAIASVTATVENGYEPATVSETSFTLNGDKTITVSTTPTVYDITYANVGEGDYADAKNSSLNPTNYTVLTSASLTDPTWLGHTFAGWYDGNGKRISVIEPGMYGNLTLSAKWTVDVTFDADGGAPEPAAQAVTVGGTASEPTQPSKSGYSFGGWQQKGTAFDFSTPLYSATALKAKWNASLYAVTLNANAANGVTLTPATSEANVVTDFAIGANAISFSDAVKLPSATRQGFTFGGWNTASDGSGDTYVAGTKYDHVGTGLASVELFAQWAPQTYTVVYNANGGTASVASTSAAYGTPSALATATRDGYTFDGWTLNNAAVSGDTTAALDAEAAKGSSVITLVAAWTADIATTQPTGHISIPTSADYEITASVDDSPVSSGGSVDVGKTVKITVTPKTGKKVTDVSAGNVDGSPVTTSPATVSVPFTTPQTFTFTMPEGSVVLTATAVAETAPTAKYALYLGANANARDVAAYVDGAPVSSGSQVTQGATVVLTATANSGYELTGWTFSPTLTMDTATSFTMPGSSVTATPTTSLKKYTVTINANGGTGGSATATVSDNGTVAATGAFTAPTRTGYTLTGWATDAAGANAFTLGSTVVTNNITLYAQWTANTYTIEFDRNYDGSSYTKQTQSGFTYDTAKSLNGISTIGYTRSGYDFTGWNTLANGTGTNYADQAQVLNLTADPAGTATLFAQWSAISYPISYDLAGGSWTSGYAAPATYTVETAATLPVAANVNRDNYTFDGWYVSDPSSVVSTYGGDGTTTGAVTLKAKWTPVQNTLSWTSADVTVSSVKADSSAVTNGGAVAYGATVEATATASSDYTILWEVAYNDGAPRTTTYAGTSISFSMPAYDTTITVTSSRNAVETYVVTFDSQGGSTETAAKVEAGSAVTTLPTPTWTGHTFQGWFSAASGGTQVTPPFTPSDDVTLYAQWTSSGTGSLTEIYNVQKFSTFSGTASTNATDYALEKTNKVSNVPAGNDITATVTSAGLYSQYSTNYDFVSTLSDSTYTVPIGGAGAVNYFFSPKGVDVASVLPTGVTAVFLDENGAEKPLVSGQAPYGAKVKLTAAQSTPSATTQVEVDGVNKGATAEIDTKAMPTTIATSVTYDSHTITYAAGAGSGSMSGLTDNKATAAADGDFTVANCTFTAPTGYQFKEWSGSDSSSYAPGATIPATADITLTAVWEASDHTITLQAPTTGVSSVAINGSVVAAGATTTAKSDAVVTLSATPSPADNHNVTWVITPTTGSKITLSSTDSGTVDFTMLPTYGNVTIKVAASSTGGMPSNTVTLKYGNGTEDAVSDIADGSKLYEPKEPTRDGYDFQGWFNSADDTAVEFPVTVNSDLVLVAKWKLADTPTGTEVTEEPTPDGGTETTVKTNEPTDPSDPTGDTPAETSTETKPVQDPENPSDPDATVPHISEVSTTNSAGDSVTFADPSDTANGPLDKLAAPDEAAADGYYLVLTVLLEGSELTGVTKQLYDAHSDAAVYKVDLWRISKNTGDATQVKDIDGPIDVTLKLRTSFYDQTVTVVHVHEESATDKRIVNTYSPLNADAQGDVEFSISTLSEFVVFGDAAVTNTVTYAAGEGSGTGPDAATALEGLPITVAANTFTAPTDKAFTKWAVTGSYKLGSATEVTTGGELEPGAVITPTTNLTLTAQWTTITETTLTVDANGGSFSGSTSVTKDSGQTVTLTNPTRAGYRFDGWDIAKTDSTSSGSVGTLTEGSGVYTYTFGTANATITAKWEQLPYASVTVNPNGGTWKNSSATQLVQMTNGVAYALGTPTRANYVFRGWALNGGGRLSGTSYTPDGTPATLTATWRIADIPVYRVYQPATGEHHYTTDANEFRVLTSRYGWRNEGIAWYSPVWSRTPVYRVYLPSTGEHHYTTDANEFRVLTSRYGWRNEGVAWYSVDGSVTSPTSVVVRRMYLAGARFGHHYSADYNEFRVLTTRYGWRNEGTAWYATRLS